MIALHGIQIKWNKSRSETDEENVWGDARETLRDVMYFVKCAVL